MHHFSYGYGGVTGSALTMCCTCSQRWLVLHCFHFGWSWLLVFLKETIAIETFNEFLSENSVLSRLSSGLRNISTKL